MDFCNGYKVCVYIYIYSHECLVIPVSNIKKTIFFPLYYLCSLSKINLLYLFGSIYGLLGFLVALVVKNSPTNRGDLEDLGSIPESGRSPGEGNDNPVQYSCLENPIDRGTWWTTVHGVKRAKTRRSD